MFSNTFAMPASLAAALTCRKRVVMYAPQT